MADEPGIFEIMYSNRAMRRLKPDPVPEELLLKLLDAANQGPTGSNMQGARWIVVRDPEQRAALAALNAKAVKAYVGAGQGQALPHHPADKRARMVDAVLWQAEHLAEIPALIIACSEFPAAIPPQAAAAAGGGSIWPAIQNLLLAARALGLGAAPTTLGLADTAASRKILNLPDHVWAYCLIPVGYPLGNFGPVTRLPVADTVRWDRWE